MVDKRGVIGIVYDFNTAFYFLILHKNLPEDKSWEFVKGMVVGEQESTAAMRSVVDSKLGIRQYKIVRKLDGTFPLTSDGEQVHNEVFLIEASMNTPVHLDYDPNKINTYLWGSKRSAIEKLRPEHKDILDKAMAALAELHPE